MTSWADIMDEHDIDGGRTPSPPITPDDFWDDWLCQFPVPGELHVTGGAIGWQ